MQEILNSVGLTQEELVTTIMIAIAALVALGLLRTMVKLTAAFLRLGCAVVIIIVIVLFLINIFN